VVDGAYDCQKGQRVNGLSDNRGNYLKIFITLHIHDNLILVSRSQTAFLLLNWVEKKRVW